MHDMGMRNSRSIRRAAPGLLAALGLVMAGISVAIAQQEARLPSRSELAGRHANPTRDALTGLPKPSQRAREGSLLTDEIGSFEFVGDRVIFVPAARGDSFRVLENLALERIVRELGDGREQRNWVVSGLLTEYRGANFLLVTKSLIKDAPSAAHLRPAKPARAEAAGNPR